MNKSFLFLFISSFITFGAFVLFSYLVAKEYFNQVDFDTTVKVQDRLSDKFIGPFSSISVLGSAEIIAIACIIIIIWLVFRKYYLTGFSIFLLPIALFIELLGKLFILHPGPPKFMHKTLIPFDLPSFYVHTDFSYPSGHTLRLTFLILILFFILTYRKPVIYKYLIGGVATLAIIAVCVSRVYLGEHWVTDVVGGFLLGSSLALFTGSCLYRKQIN